MKDNKINFIKSILDNLELPTLSDRATYLDKKVNGLQIKITSSGIKTFCVRKRLQDGKVTRITLGRYPDMSIEQARKEATRINALIVDGVNPNEKTNLSKLEISLENLFDQFLSQRRNKRVAYLAEKTLKTYRYDFKNHFSKWGKKKLSEFKDTDFIKLHTEIGLKHPTSANRIIAMASSLFSYAIDLKLFKGENPAKNIKKFPETKRDRFLQSDELPAFFNALSEEPNETLRDFFLVSLLTGARRSNVCSMKWEDIHLERCEWRIPFTKNGELHTVTLTEEVVEILKSRKGCNETWVFPGCGASGHLVEPKKAWKRILNRASIDNLRIHDLRRTLGSWQAKTGASLVIVGKSLNHKSPSTTAIYARLDLDPVRESVTRATNAMLVAAGIKK